MLIPTRQTLPTYLLPLTIIVLSCSGSVLALPSESRNSAANNVDQLNAKHHVATLNESNLNVCEKLVRNNERVKVPPVARPPYLSLYREPGFGTKTQRISNSAFGRVTKPAGNPAQAWNIDESLLLLHRYNNDGDHELVLLDGRTYQELRVLDLPTVKSENIYWSHKDPSLLYFVAETGRQAGELTQFNVSNNQQTVMKDFAPVCKKAGFTANSGLLAKPSYDDNSFGYQCGVSQQRSLAIAYHHSVDSLHTLAVGRGAKTSLGIPPAPLPNGKQYWLQGKVFNEKLALSKVKIDMADSTAAHTLASTVNNQSVLYQAPSSASPGGCNQDLWNGNGLVIEHATDVTSCNPLINQSDNYPITPAGTDLFASAYLSPRWLAMSSVGYKDIEYFSNKRFAPLLFSEIYLVNTDRTADTEICRLAHHRTFGRSAKNAQYDAVLGEPNVTVSPSATRVLFASDWYDSGLVDTYVLELPDYTPFDLSGNWVDENNSGMLTKMEQRGDNINFQRIPTVNTGVRPVITTGEGKISNKQIQIDYIVDATKNRKVPGKCLATISRDAKSIVFECRDNFFGRLYTKIVRQQ